MYLLRVTLRHDLGVEVEPDFERTRTQMLAALDSERRSLERLLASEQAQATRVRRLIEPEPQRIGGRTALIAEYVGDEREADAATAGPPLCPVGPGQPKRSAEELDGPSRKIEVSGVGLISEIGACGIRDSAVSESTGRWIFSVSYADQIRRMSSRVPCEAGSRWKIPGLSRWMTSIP